jgi:hypothetical protein
MVPQAHKQRDYSEASLLEMLQTGFERHPLRERRRCLQRLRQGLTPRLQVGLRVTHPSLSQDRPVDSNTGRTFEPPFPRLEITKLTAEHDILFAHAAVKRIDGFFGVFRGQPVSPFKHGVVQELKRRPT